MEILDKVLKPEQKAAGISLEEDDHGVYLMHEGKVKVRFGYMATVESVWHEADQIVAWQRSGIEVC